MCLLEIKSSIKDNMIFSIKHKQIFNDKNNYIAVVKCELDNSGSSIEDLYNFFKNTKPFSENINFIIKLEAEKKKISSSDFALKKLNYLGCSLFLNKDLVTIKLVPDWISNLSYDFDFVGQKETSMVVIVSNIK